MTGRGIDQGLPHPSGPQLYEPDIASAEGSFRHPVAFDYIGGDAVPDLRLINPETAVTTNEHH